MCGSKCVTDIKVGQRRELAHDHGLRLLFVRELEFQLKESLLLGHIAHILQQQNFAVLQTAHSLLRSRAANILDELHGSSEQFF